MLPAPGFRDVLRRERALAERASLSFAVLAFHLERSEPRIDSNALLAVVAARLRATDVVGWLSDGELGVLLRYASVLDAVRVSAQLRARLAPASLPSTVYGYPPFELQRRSTAAAPRLANPTLERLDTARAPTTHEADAATRERASAAAALLIERLSNPSTTSTLLPHLGDDRATSPGTPRPCADSEGVESAPARRASSLPSLSASGCDSGGRVSRDGPQ